ncbi:hypothetical protein M9Y10_022957 [Tritrichomonas musculus]|uniref:Uncharacterized protein n=1 Tax=Tritrichomonas musculus TaxID=1915356 RepID=A0ABR2KU01_9EUKA
MKVRKKNKSISEYNSEDIHNIVNSLIAGAPLSRYPEALHPKLLMPLSAAKNEAIVAGKSAAVKRIQSIMPKLQLTPQSIQSRSQLATKLNTRNYSGSQTPSVSSRSNSRDPEADPNDEQSVLDELLRGRLTETVDDSQVKGLIPLIKERTTESVKKGDFKTAQKLEDILQEMNSRNLEAEYKFYRNDQLSRLQFQLMNAQEALENAKRDFKEHEKELNESYLENQNQLKQSHLEQLKEYDESFPEVLPVNFWKVSPQVLQLREQERQLVSTHRFEEAIPFHEKADQMENEELDVQRKKFLQAFHVQRQQLLNVQANQLECFEKNCQRKFDEMKIKKNKDLNARKQLVTNLERRIKKLENEGRACSQLSAIKNDPETENESSYYNNYIASSQVSNRNRPTSRSLPMVSSRKLPRSPASVNPRIRSIAATRVNLSRKSSYIS